MSVDGLNRALQVVARDLNAARDEVKRLREAATALARWTQHSRTCARSATTADACTCGLNEAWAAIDETNALNHFHHDGGER